MIVHRLASVAQRLYCGDWSCGHKTVLDGDDKIGAMVAPHPLMPRVMVQYREERPATAGNAPPVFCRKSHARWDKYDDSDERREYISSEARAAQEADVILFGAGARTGSAGCLSAVASMAKTPSALAAAELRARRKAAHARLYQMAIRETTREAVRLVLQKGGLVIGRAEVCLPSRRVCAHARADAVSLRVCSVARARGLIAASHSPSKVRTYL